MMIVPRVVAPRRRPAASIAVRPVSFTSPPLAVVVHRLLRRRQELNQPRLKAFLKATLENRRALFDRVTTPIPRAVAHAQSVSVEENMAKMEGDGNSLYPIAVLIDELRNDDVQVGREFVVY